MTAAKKTQTTPTIIKMMKKIDTAFKICIITMLLSLLFIIAYLFAKTKSITVFPQIPNNFILLCYMVLTSVCLTTIAMLLIKKGKKKFAAAAVSAAVCFVSLSVLVYFNVPFRNNRDDISIPLPNGSIRISRFYLLTEQRLQIQFVPNALYAKDLNFRIIPVSQSDFDDCVVYEWHDDNTVEIRYTASDSEEYTWLYDVQSQELIDSGTDDNA